MARIRSIHPNAPTDPDFALIPIAARLLFIYSWTIADDAGNLEASPRGLKMALFPGDDSITRKKIERMVDALIEGRFFIPYEADGKRYLHIRSFPRYQKPDHPTAPKYPLFPGQSYSYDVRQGNSWISKTVEGPNSVNVPRRDGERSENVLAGIGIGKERKGKESERSPVVPTSGNGADGPGATAPAALLPEDVQTQLSRMKHDVLSKTLGEYHAGNRNKASVVDQLRAANFTCVEMDLVYPLLEEGGNG